MFHTLQRKQTEQCQKIVIHACVAIDCSPACEEAFIEVVAGLLLSHPPSSTIHSSAICSYHGCSSVYLLKAEAEDFWKKQPACVNIVPQQFQKTTAHIKKHNPSSSISASGG